MPTDISDRTRIYLGDGVYVIFDGYQIWLETEREDGVHRIALEPEVYSRLAEYVRALPRLASTGAEA